MIDQRRGVLRGLLASFRCCQYLGQSARWTWPVARWCLLTLAATLLALYTVGAAVRAPFHLLPTGVSTSATVPMFNAWTIWWNADRLACGLEGYWDAPIFHPIDGAFAFSEPQPATWAVAPIVWLSGSPIPAYHVYLVASLALNGLFAARLLLVIGSGWSVSARWTAALVGGVSVLLLPILHQHLDVLQLVPLWAVLWTLESLLKLNRQPAWQRGLELGIAFSLVFMTSVHHGLFLLLLLVLTGWICFPLKRWRCGLVGAGAAALTAAALLGPLLWPMHRIHGRHDFRRSERSVAALSAAPADWLHVPPTALFGGTPAAAAARPLMPGWLRGGLASLAIVLALAKPVGGSAERRTILLLVAFTGAAIVCSLGLNLQWRGWQPWAMLGELAPPFARVRSVFRFAYFAQLGIVLLAATALGRLQHHLATATRPRGWGHGLLGIVLASAGILVALEAPPAAVRAVGVPEISRQRPWTRFLRQHTPAGRGIVCLPFDRGYAANDFTSTARWMLYATQHHAPLVNGYSGFFPESWIQMTRRLHAEPLGDAALAALVAAKVEFVVIDRRQLASDPPTDPAGAFYLRAVFRDPSGVDIYRLLPSVAETGGAAETDQILGPASE